MEVGEVEGQNEAVYVAMQPGEMEVGQVEVQDCQEVVIVAEGGEVSDLTESIQLGESQVVAIGAEEVYEEAFVDDSKDEKPDFSLLSKKLKHASRYSLPSNLQMHYDQSPSVGTWTDLNQFSYSSPRKYRPGAGKSLAKMRKVEVAREISSDEESDSYNPTFMPSTSMLPHKTPKRREFAHRLQWRNRDMLEGMKAVEEQKMTIRGAAKKYNVPYSTLKDRVHGRVRHGAKPGVKTILSPEEEDELSKFVRDMENAGFQLRCVDVRDRAAELLRLNHGHNSPYKDGSPGHNWFHGFVKRHPGLEFKRTVKRNIVPSISKQKHMLRRFYDITAGIYKKNKLSHKSDRIFSVSELRIGGQCEATILYAAAANGQLIAPFVIFKGNAIKLTPARQEFPDAFFTCSYDGRVNEDIFLWWFRDHFLKRVPTTHLRPGILFISRGVQDITMQLVQLAKEEKMHLVGMAFGISHLVQPLDDDVSDMIKNTFNRRFKKWQDENPGQGVTQKVVAAVLRKVWSKVNPEEIASKFTANGIYPLNAYAITQDKLLTGAHILREMVERSPPRSENYGSSSSGLSGLNLLSALSSHEYATLDMDASNNLAPNRSFENQSDLSANDNQNVSVNDYYPNYKVVIKRQPGKENQVVVVPLNETSESGVVEQVEVQSSELLETEEVEFQEEPEEEVERQQPTAEQLQELLEKQREYQIIKRATRPSVDILRQTDVTRELDASRDTQQISKAVDSILGNAGMEIKREPRSPSTRSASEDETLPETQETTQNAPQTDDNTTVIRIAPDKIKDEISKAIQSGSFSKTNTLKLSDYHGNDIKIQIRIKNPDEMKGSRSQGQTSMAPPVTAPTPVISKVISLPTSQAMAEPPEQKPQIHRIIRMSPQGQIQGQTLGQGRFIQVAAPSGSGGGSGASNIVIQSSQIRTKSGHFSPILKVEKVQESLPSQFLEADDDVQGPTLGYEEEEIVGSQEGVIVDGSQHDVVTQEVVTSHGEQVEEMETSDSVMQVVVGDDGQEYIMSGEQQTVEGGAGAPGEDCVVRYINADGQLIQLQTMQQHQ